ncbi:DNA/RNA non-specific endonuclease [Hymenobacter sp. BT491]|uniref:DNA/RNA non-specific endonuclease n=1 Tax=Hymenobacter sp. BT491 TaxID=2766779 RepID=UPI0016538668|nr:DNA/RNA non-specific endonuclease [Hymenobacter sp. BT491]MBC6990287.1 DNA/RNA non-specific endonuclease [Hymenobacter sp. BT491]
MRPVSSLLLYGLLLSLTPLACSQQQPETTSTVATAPPMPTQAQTSTGSVVETFETGSKGAYTEADETLATGTWHFTDALIGSSPTDHKNGSHAARLRGKGRLRMNFNAPSSTRQIRVSAAAFGDDQASTWELWISQDGGRRYVRTGAPVRTTSPRLSVSSFPVSGGNSVRLEIRKTDGSSSRLNVDDIEFVGGTGVATTGSTTSPTLRTTAGNPPIAAIVTSREDNLALGNPSGATSSLDNFSNYLMVKPQYTLSYNRDRGTPNWVSWHLNRAWMGSAPRQDDFRPDPALPRGWYSVTPHSYAGSGFDKGHNCPSADRTTDLDDNSATFLMTNMIPQAPNNNQRTWSSLEEYGRSLVNQGYEIYVIMGNYGKGGTGLNGRAVTLDEGRVTVPARVWKVLVIIPEGADDLQRIAAGQARILAVDTPNDNSIDPDWSRYRVSVDAIEDATGLDLLSALPVEVQDRLEATVDSRMVR